MNVNGKTVLITGASRGIGRECARLMAREGYNVVINYYHSEAEAAFLYEQLKELELAVMLYRADVSDRQQVRAMVQDCIKTYGRIDVLVNNTGTAKSGMLLEISDYEWDLMTSVQLKGLFNCCKSVIPYMMKRKYGRIINVSSAWSITGGTCEIHYSTTKAAVIGFTKALSKELAPSNISVNCITPGVVESDLIKGLTPSELEELQRDIPLQKFAKPEEIAMSILSLAAGCPDYITGQVLSAQGGFAV